MLLTLISTALRHDLDVWAYLKAAIDQLQGGSTDYHSLRPDVWKLAHPEFVRVYRTEVVLEDAPAEVADRVLAVASTGCQRYTVERNHIRRWFRGTTVGYPRSVMVVCLELQRWGRLTRQF
jgi:hypothetical protein